MIRRGLLLAAGCLVVATRGSFGQEPLLLPSDRDASAQLSKIIETTAAAGLPVSSIIEKVNYGRLVTRSRPDSIVAAARAVASRLEIARDALAPNATDSDIQAGAMALARGANKESLQAIRQASRTRPVAVPLGFLVQLLSEPNNIKLDRATKVVTDLITRGAKDAQLVAVGNAVNKDVAAGILGSVDTRVQGLAAVLSPPGTTGFGDAVNAPTSGTGLTSVPRGNPPVPPKRP